jgi:hypothetical protein
LLDYQIAHRRRRHDHEKPTASRPVRAPRLY